MHSQNRHTPRRRGSALLLHHCAVLERIVTDERVSARHRLEAALGQELAALLLRGLGGAQRPRPSVGLF
jgi:hypothetical protein